MKTLIVVLALFCTGCTVKLNGEASMMKRWDRPAETTTATQTDTSAAAVKENILSAPQQGSVGTVK